MRRVSSVVAAALVAAAALFATATPGIGQEAPFDDVPVDHVFAGDIDWLAAEGITRGCNPPDNSRFCPDDPVTRGQMAAFLVRGLGLSESGASFEDTEGHVFEGDISRLALAGITRGCNPPDNSRFCPDDPVTRGQMAAFLHRALENRPPTVPDALSILTTSFPDGNRDIAFEARLRAEGGIPPYTWFMSDLPPGLSGAGDGTISGTPTDPGEYRVSALVTDAAGDTDSRVVPLEVTNVPVITPASLPTLHVFEAYHHPMDAISGDQPLVWSSPDLPGGLVIDPATGEIGNDPAAPGITDATSGDVTIRVTDHDGDTDEVVLGLDVVGVDTIAAGAHHTCSIDEEASAWCWGQDFEGQLGDGPGAADASSDVPVRVQTGDVNAFTAVTAGIGHTCALDGSGGAWCWGNNDVGQLGDGNGAFDATSDVPVRVQNVDTFTSISAGNHHTCGIDTDGAAWCWGDNDGGQLGDGNGGIDMSSDLPVEVADGHEFQGIAAGDNHTCAVDTAGVGWCWGVNESGQLGDGNGGLGVTSDTPVEVVMPDVDTFDSIDGGGSHTCAVDTDGAAWCWGFNHLGQVGNGNSGGSPSTPQAVEDGPVFASLSAGTTHTCGLDTDGAAWCWGYHLWGQLGIGPPDPFPDSFKTTPQSVLGGHAFVTIAGGGAFTCGVDVTAAAWCWGSNSSGKLGNPDVGWNGGPVPVPAPVPVHPGNG